jgi:hypothetical protein
MRNEEIEYLRGITAYDFLNETATDGEVFNTRVVITFLKLKFGDNSLKSLEKFTEQERSEVEELDELLQEDLNYLDNEERLHGIIPEHESIEPKGDSGLWLTPKQIKQIRKTDTALEELFKTFKKGYTDNLPKN